MMKNKKIWYAITAAVILVWLAYRIFAIYSESARVVFNPVRAADKNGQYVEKVEVVKKNGTLKEPLFIKNNRAYVSCNRVNRFRAGQHIGTGRITSVSYRVDLDSGMCIVRTSGVADGAGFAEVVYNGYFIPVYAVKNGRLMIAENGTAALRDVVIAGEDSQNVVISKGLSDGEIIIVSDIDEGRKVR